MLPAWEPAELPADAVEVGRILDAWGLKGWFKVLPHSASPEALFSCKRWFLQPNQRGASPFTGTVVMPIREAKEHGDSVVACATESMAREVAQSLKGARIFVPRSSFPSTQEDEFYWVDLMGLEVSNRQGQPLGTVTDLMSTGAQTVLVLTQPNPQDSAKPLERMIPFVSAYVDKVDLASRTILVDWQADY
jgi:16S rRNA processing protein RimM